MIKFIAVAAISMAMFSSCGNGGKGSANGGADSTSADKELSGAGSTFGNPIYTKMFDVYNQKTGVKTNYQANGSGAGISMLVKKTVDFGATDAFMSDKDIQGAGADIVHIPTCLGAVAISYNLPGDPKLKFTGDLLAKIYLGKITKWNDKAIAAENPDAKLPNLDILVAHRADGSGTSYIFTDFLSKSNDDWKNGPGANKNPAWPAGVGGKSNDGVAGLIKQTSGAIGYVELIYALKNNMVFADVKNPSGKYITPSLASTSAAADIDIPADCRLTITNSAAAEAYPISSFTWIVLYKEQKYGDRSLDKATNLVKLLWWATHDGQQYCEPLQYAKLPAKAVSAVEGVLKSVTYDGKAILSQNP